MDRGNVRGNPRPLQPILPRQVGNPQPSKVTRPAAAKQFVSQVELFLAEMRGHFGVPADGAQGTPPVEPERTLSGPLHRGVRPQ